MSHQIALRCPSHHAAEAAAGCLEGETARRLLSPRAVAVVWFDRKGRCQVKHGLRPMERAAGGWASWIMLSAAAWSGGYVDVALHAADVALPERIDQATLRTVASALLPGEGALIVSLSDPTPLLLVEAVRRHARGLVWSTLPAEDEELISTILEANPA
jgi:uncharacterized membrane protein